MDSSKQRIRAFMLAAAVLAAGLAVLPPASAQIDPPVITCSGPADPCPEIVPCPDEGVGDGRALCSYPCEPYDTDPETAVVGTILRGPLDTSADACAEECTGYYDYWMGGYYPQDGYVVHTPAGPVNACYEQACRFYDSEETPPHREGTGVMVNGQPYCLSPCGASMYDPWGVDREGYTVATPVSQQDACYENYCRHDDGYGPYVNPGTGITLNGNDPYCAEDCQAYIYDPSVDQEGYTVVTPDNSVPACYEQGCRYFDWWGSTKTDGTGITLNGEAYCVEKCPDGQEGTMLVVPDTSPIGACQDADSLVATALALAESLQQVVEDQLVDPPCKEGAIVAAGTCVGPVEPCTGEEGLGFHLGFADACTGGASVERCDPAVPPSSIGLVVNGEPVCVPSPTTCEPGSVGVVVNGLRLCVSEPSYGFCEAGKLGVIVNGQRVCVDEPQQCDSGTGVEAGGIEACAKPCSGPNEVGAEVGDNRLCQAPPPVEFCELPRVGVTVGPFEFCL